MKNKNTCLPTITAFAFFMLFSIRSFAQCNVQANFNFTFQNSQQDVFDTLVLTSTSTSAYSIASIAWSVEEFVGSFSAYGSGSTNPMSLIVHYDSLYRVCLIVVDSMSCRDTTCAQIRDSAACNLTADFSYTLLNSDTSNADTLTITNTSVSNTTLGSYDISTTNSLGQLVSFQAGIASGSTYTYTVPQTQGLNVCLSASTASGGCRDTVCKWIYNFTGCSMNASFHFTNVSSALLLYNTSTSLAPPFTSVWHITGDTTVTLTTTNPVLFFPTYMNHFDVCLITTDAQGCSDTTCQTAAQNDTLCGIVFNDANSNNNYDWGEQVMAGAGVYIDNSFYQTDSTGFYHVAVGQGTHSIYLTGIFGWTQTLPTNPTYYTITTAQNNYICGLDFGLRDDTTTVSGVVYDDNNANGIYDAGDSPRGNVTVHVNGPNGNYSTNTNSAGHYSRAVFTGTYSVYYTAPAGYVYTQPINPNTYTVVVASSSVTGLNFGVRNTVTVISGKLFVDANGNGTYDTGESLVGGQPVHIGTVTAYTNSSGNYSVVVTTGTYTVSYTPTSAYSLYTSTPANYTVAATTAGTTYAGNDFALYLTPGTGSICVDLTAYTNVVQNHYAWWHIYVYNNGNLPMAGKLYMYYDPNLTYTGSTVTPANVDATNQVVTWNINSNAGQTISIVPKFNVAGGLAVGFPLFNAIEFIPDSGFVNTNTACNMDTLHQVIQAAFDPNDKEVSPVGEGADGKIVNSQLLDYNITFQNTGDAPAVNVILRDTLDADLDISTFEMKAASHEYHLQLENRELIWIFSNIMLPDSGTDFDASIGFVSYRIKPLPNLADGTQLLNTAGIYFDYNDVVITNTTLNTIDEKTVGINAVAASKAVISIYPNPFKEITRVKIEGVNTENIEAQMTDITGRVIRHISTHEGVIDIRRENLSAGLYIIKVYSNGTPIGKIKVVAQ